ncbi:hypothetical protein [Polyangium mundeleinium]|uniref:Uncharacterized protein n=1 Tax=Polyangium mundeleinium TaxID=2995306 RepID=A0ABT5F7H4_9BACT|nr:hypothetical protein [Polyangium mundeleinium]MDC0750049.1 hypothetical protein [Polyangium mundeleinium]
MGPLIEGVPTWGGFSAGMTTGSQTSSTGGPSGETAIDCAQSLPLPAGHSAPAGIAFVEVQEPSQSAGPPKGSAVPC